MAGTRKAPAEKKTAAKKPAARKKAAPKAAPKAPELVFEEGYWFIVSGTTRLNAGRSKQYAQRLMDEGVGR